MNREELVKYVKGFPDKPGVYLMRDKDDKIIYVGKAKSLKKRVSSYFRHANSYTHPKLRKLVSEIVDISTIRTETEMEALLLENRLIKLYQPFFNIDLKMNERYAYIKIPSEKFPRLEITRHKADDGSVYIGPYVRVAEVRWLLRLIERHMPLRNCTANIDNQNKDRPCMRFQLGRCLAPCCGKCTESEYKERVADIIMLLQGNNAEVVERLRGRMNAAANRLEFEKAARLRDTIRAIWQVSRQRSSIPDKAIDDESHWLTLNSIQKIFNLKVLPWRIEGFDISHTAGNQTVGVAVVFEQGYPNPSLYRRFNIKTVEGIDDFRSMHETLTRRYKRCIEGQEPMPQLILIDGGPVQLEFAHNALRNLGLEIPVISLAKRLEEVYVVGQKEPVILEYTDPVLKLFQFIRDESHRYAITSHRARRGKIFRQSKLENIPGIGKSKAAMLITKFGSVRAISDLSEEELSSAPGIGPALAKKILKYLSQVSGSEINKTELRNEQTESTNN